MEINPLLDFYPFSNPIFSLGLGNPRVATKFLSPKRPRFFNPFKSELSTNSILTEYSVHAFCYNRDLSSISRFCFSVIAMLKDPSRIFKYGHGAGP